MDRQVDWRGVFPALTTAFTKDDALDFEAMAGQLERQLEAGVHGVIILGSLGENATLSAAEKREMVGFFHERVAQRVPLVACIAESSTREAVDFLKDATQAGADGFMLLPPMRYCGTRRETLHYLQTIGAASSRPIMLYNNPVAYETDLTPEDFVTLAEVPAFKAIKESAADTRRFPEIRRRCGDRYALFCGVDDLAFECFTLGAVGWVAGLVVAFPRETVRLYELMAKGRWDEAREWYEWFLPLLHLDIGSRFVQQIKYVMELHGVGSSRVRGPRMELTEREREAIAAIYEQAIASHPGL